MDNTKNIQYIIEKYGKTQNCIYFKIILPKYTNVRIIKIKKIFIVSIICLFSSIFLINKNASYAIFIFVLMFVTYIFLNKILSRFKTIGEISFYKDHLEIMILDSNSNIVLINYDEIIKITSQVGLDELFKSPKRPLPLITLVISFQTKEDSFSFEAECVPFNKIFDNNSYRYKLWLENILNAIDENYIIKDITRKKENVI